MGESGCGKSTLGLALPRLLPERDVEYSGRIWYKGVDILSLREEQLEKFRGTELAMIFQEPMTSLNPIYRVGEQVAEAFWVRNRRSEDYFEEQSHPKPKLATGLLRQKQITLRVGRRTLKELIPKTRGILADLQIPHPERVAEMYPHEFSGGMKQRIMIAMALAGNPSFLIADEPTTALDVTTQMQILSLLRDINHRLGMGILLITHDLGVVAAIADYGLVMYGGKIIEEAPTAELFENPLHPYTVGLMNSFPTGHKDDMRLETIPGIVPPLGRFPSGCRFSPRCQHSFDKCRVIIPRPIQVSENHKVSCFLYGE